MRLQMQLDCEYGKTKPWVETPNGFFTGSVFIDDRLLSQQDIREALEGLGTCEQATAFVKRLNGHFAVALCLEGTVFLATDRERTVPLFYELQEDTVLVYNHITLDMIRRHGIRKSALDELDCCLFVSGTETLAKGILSVTAGETVEISDSGVARKYYHEFRYERREYPDADALFRLIDDTFVNVTKRLITYLNGRCAVVPLSGGHDSRLIVYYLKRLGYDNILTYTYGPEGHFEVTTSEKVAAFLGLDWHGVAYNPAKLQRLFKTKFSDLVEYCLNGVSSVCIQDWYAVEHLHTSGVLPRDAVFVPGHSFDAIAGSFILPKYVEKETITKQELINDLIWKHYSEGKRPLPPSMRDYYVDIFRRELLENEPESLTSDRAFNLYQDYNVRERQAKYICCQPKLYEYYGYDWYLPLWDNELIAFWETIDLKRKFNRKLFFAFAEHTYGDLMKAAPVENEKSKNPKKVNMNPLVRVVRKIHQLIHYVDFHYCLAYFTRADIWSIYIRKRVLNIGFTVNQKIKRLLRDRL